MTFVYFILVLGITILIHELGHFIFAKKAGVYVYEFAIGMGPRIFKFTRKNDETVYSVRLFPIGGFVSMAGEDSEDENEVPKDRQLCNKSWMSRFLTLFAGIAFNFLLALIILFCIGLVNGVPKNQLEIATIGEGYPMAETNIQIKDNIVAINNKKIKSYEHLVLELAVHTGKAINFTVMHENNKEETITVMPIAVKTDDGEVYSYGFTLSNNKEFGFIPAIRYSFEKTGNLIHQMGLIVSYLATGKLSLDNLSGPVGIFQVVETAASAGFLNIIYLIAYLCINVGFINFIPFPAFDGGRILFLIIEKIKGSKINPKVENIIHTIGFILIIILMIFVTFNDLGRLFN